MKRKLFLLVCAMLASVGLWAQTDVTSTYLTNADFETDEALTSDYLYGYGKDGSPYGFQTVTGWTSVVTAGDNGNPSYPNSGMAGGVFSYGSSTQLKGGGQSAPATNPDGEASGNCFGFFGVWGCGGYYYQNVNLAAGKYTITVPMYNKSGTQANTTYTGFFPTSGTNRTVAVNPTVGQWVNQTVTFTLADETPGQIRIGYQSTGSGSGANPMLFIDRVKIEFTALVVKDALETAIANAQSVNSRISSSTLATAISTAQAVYNDENATQEQVNNAAATLDTAVETAMADFIVNGGDATLALANADLSSKDGWTADASSGFRDFNNGLIGDYTVRFSPATVDETHLATESCFGFEARWNGNYASYNQTTVALPAGVYTLTYDVENVNSNTSNLTYADYNFVQVGDTKYYSSTTEWMQAKSGWTTHTIHVTLNEPAPITVSFGYGTGSNNPSADVTPAIYVSHVQLAYENPLDGAKAIWEEAKAAAEAAIGNEAYVNVTGSERTALQAEIDKAEPTTLDGYNAATEALNTATSAFTAAKPSYDVYAEANSIATVLEVSVTAPTTAEEAVTRTKELYVNIDTKVKSTYKYDVTDIYAGDFTGFTDTSKGQHWSGDADKAYIDGWGNTTVTATQDITLPAGRYVLKAVGRATNGTNAYMSANGTTVNYAKNGDTGKGVDMSGAVNYGEGDFAYDGAGRGWEWRFIPVNLDAETTITVNLTLERSWDWGSFCDFTILLDADPADQTDYDNLNAAIAAADAKTLGFEDGEYAPYNNVDALTKLATARAIDQSEENAKFIVEDVTSQLNAATWTQNDGDVNAVYNGNFSSAQDWGLTGWTRTNAWGQQRDDLPANSGADTNYGYYNQPGSLQYGNAGVYTMPLKENTIYELSFKYASWENNSNNGMTVSVLNGEDGMAAMSFPANKTQYKNEGAFVTQSLVFATGVAGNYVLTLANNGNTVMTDVSITKAASQTLSFSEDANLPSYAPGTYPRVEVTRTLIGNQWNTLVLPFEYSNNAWTIKEFTASDDEKLTFSDVEGGTMTAGTPYLVKPNENENTTSIIATNVAVVSTSSGVTQGDFTFTPVYTQNTITGDGSNYFVATGTSTLYRAMQDIDIKGFRAYFHYDGTSSEAREVVINFDGETAINAVEAAEEGEALKDGKYLIDGKVVIVKNGVKYSANGQILK